MSSVEVRPFTIFVPEEEVEELRSRLRRTRWPEPATVDDWSQGVPLDYARDVCGYWADAYDWRRCETGLNGAANFVTELGGLDIHFQHIRSRHDDATPMIVTHGWPGSVLEFQKVIGPLTDPTAHGGGPPVTRSTSCCRRCPASGGARSRRRPAPESRSSPRCGTS
jgi:hypothetical protein